MKTKEKVSKKVKKDENESNVIPELLKSLSQASKDESSDGKAAVLAIVGTDTGLHLSFEGEGKHLVLMISAAINSSDELKQFLSHAISLNEFRSKIDSGEIETPLPSKPKTQA